MQTDLGCRPLFVAVPTGFSTSTEPSNAWRLCVALTVVPLRTCGACEVQLLPNRPPQSQRDQGACAVHMKKTHKQYALLTATMSAEKRFLLCIAPHPP